MVERPIKKSERQAKPDDQSNPEVSSESSPKSQNFVPPVKSDRKDRDRNQDNRRDKSEGRGKGKGRKSSDRDEIKAPLNPALARPPKPSKPPAKVEAQPEEILETVAEESQDSSEVTSVAVAEESQDSSEN